MASIFLAVHPTKGTQEQFSDSLRDLVESKSNLSSWPSVLPQLDATQITQCVVGPNHLAFLFQDGRVCRVAYHVSSDKVDLSYKEPSDDEPVTQATCANKTPVNASYSNSTQPSTGPATSRNDHTFTISGDALSSLSGQLGRWNSSHPALLSSAGSTGATSSISSTSAVAAATRATLAGRGRGRIIRATRGRSAGAGANWLAGRVVIPASAVPEDLIAQAQVVLQGKSRQVIIRELQKTNLDVNLAVNNLLSRDDDDPDDAEADDSYLQEAYIPSEDLISIFETGMGQANEDLPFAVQRDALFPDDIVYHPSYSRAGEASRAPLETGRVATEARASTRTTLTNESSPSTSSRSVEPPLPPPSESSVLSPRDAAGVSSRMRERWWGMLVVDGAKPEKQAKASRSSTPSGRSTTATAKPKMASTTGEAVQRFGEVEWWSTQTSEDDDGSGFKQICSMHSELVAITKDGCLYRWLWQSPHPPVVRKGEHGHPRAADLKLVDKKISMASACNIRATVLTDNGKLATWLDDCLHSVAHKLEHAASTFSELKGQPITSLHVCDLYTCAQTAGGGLFWWGVFPFEQRKRILDKVKTRAKKSAISGSSLIKVGTQVCIRSCPLYYPGAVAFTTINGEPRVGELAEQAWTMSEKCRFKVYPQDIDIKSKKVEETSVLEPEHGNIFPEEKMDHQSDHAEQENYIGKLNMRKRKYIGDEDDQRLAIEENWNLKDVVFVEDIRNVPVGKVLKVDGAYALVNFSSKLLKSTTEEETDITTVLKDCRLVRKDELQIVKWTSPPKMPECIQHTPKQLSIPGGSKLLAIALDTKGVHALVKSSSSLRYAVFALASSRLETGGVIQAEPATFLSKTSPANPSLHSSGLESFILMRDPNGCIYPLVKDNLGGIRNPHWVNVPSVSSLSMGRKKVDDTFSGKSQLVVTVMIIQESELIQNVLKSDSEAVQEYLKSIENIPAQLTKCIEEKCDGNRNLLHICVSTCRPTSTKAKNSNIPTASAISPMPGSATDSNQVRYNKALELMRNVFSTTAATSSIEHSSVARSDALDEVIPTSTWPPEMIEEPAPPPVYEPSLWAPLFDGVTCLEVLLNSPALKKHLYHLLSERDAFGFTPFMSAVRIRAYTAAVKLFDAAVQLATGEDGRNDEQFMSMVCPKDAVHAHSPLHMLVCNDTCSFTWTGTTHINQDIFECKTCALVGPLCCCTECASVCHAGHECKLKKTSPTAYCDCWEKCPCKALIPGDQSNRLELLHKLVEETSLVTVPNKKGEHVLLFLVHTVARQTTEQLQFMPGRSSEASGATAAKGRGGSSTCRVRNRNGETTPPLPDHDLEPPRFAKVSLAFILKDWRALRSMLVFGNKEEEGKSLLDIDEHVLSSAMLQQDEIEKYLASQHGSALLDHFVHKLVVKCNPEYMDVLLDCIQARLKDTAGDDEKSADVTMVARRFIRSVARIFVILSACVGPNQSKRKNLLASISKCRRVFSVLNVLAAEELADMAAGVFTPVRMGVVYPSTPFSLGTAPDSTQACEELFSIPPLPERAQASSSSHRVRFDEDLQFEEVRESVPRESQDEEMDTETEEALSQDNEEVTSQQSQEAGEADIDLLAESESDSDDDDDEAARDSTRTEGAAGSAVSSSRYRTSSNAEEETGGYFSVAEASTDGASTDGDEEEDEEDEEEEEEDEVDEDNDNENDSIEQRPATTSTIADNSSAPHALQWAVRTGPLTTTGGASSSSGSGAVSAASTSGGGSGLVFIDTANMRRSGGGGGGSGASASGEGSNVASTSLYCTPSALSRTFAILIRELSDLLSLSPECNWNGCQEARRLTDVKLRSTWDWLWRVMETTEAQLRFGASLTAASDPGQSQHPLHEVQPKLKPTRTAPTAATGSNILRSWSENRRKKRNGTAAVATVETSASLRQDFLSYVLSLMRSHGNEHGNSLPKLEITSLRHVAYVLDAFIYYLRSSNEIVDNEEVVEDTSEKETSEKMDEGNPSEEVVVPVKEDESSSNKEDKQKDDTTDKPSGSTLKIEYEDDDGDDTDQTEEEILPEIDMKAFRHQFFKRSDSTLVLGYEPSDSFTTPLREALPLAERPHILNPTARRDQMFGVAAAADNSTDTEEPLTMELDGNMSSVSSLSRTSPNFYLGRWRMCLELFGRVFLDDVGAEPGSVLNELGRFDVKESKFRREMEKLRNGHQKDLYLEALDRDRTVLLQQSLRQLNSQFGRRVPGAGPLNVHKLKVQFKDEPGEGTGVVRSFYTAIGEAFLADTPLPNLDNIFSGSRGLTHQLRARARDRERDRRRSGSPGGSQPLVPPNPRATAAANAQPSRTRRSDRDQQRDVAPVVGPSQLSLDAKPYVFEQDLDEGTMDSTDDFGDTIVPVHKRVLGQRIYTRVQAHYTNKVDASKITGMLLELSPTQLIYLLTHEEAFRERMNEAYDMIQINAAASSTGQKDQTDSQKGSSSKSDSADKNNSLLDCDDLLDNTPLFYQPGKAGYYSPRAGKCGPERLSCFRNVGRIMGLSLLQNELNLMIFNRHVIKYLLGRKVAWHDLAFFDATLYSSMRQLTVDARSPNAHELFAALELNYTVQLRPEEGGGIVELIKGGNNIDVTPDNIYDYVKRYAEYRMVTVARRPLQAMRRGLLDVIPAHHLDGLTAEDFRLLLNGAGDIVVQQLIGYTFFSDETGGEGPDKLSKFKKWFWSLVENMTTKQKQDLLYFWTSSPAMPASAEGFQPMPSVTVKPSNDHQLPTANTCISRLYVPLYSSKQVLRSKLLMAIKTKVFGFV